MQTFQTRQSSGLCVLPDLHPGALGEFDCGRSGWLGSWFSSIRGGAFSARRSLLLEFPFSTSCGVLGDDRMRPCEIKDFCARVLRAGARVFWCRESVVYHRADRLLQGLVCGRR